MPKCVLTRSACSHRFPHPADSSILSLYALTHSVEQSASVARRLRFRCQRPEINPSAILCCVIPFIFLFFGSVQLFLFMPYYFPAPWLGQIKRRSQEKAKALVRKKGIQRRVHLSLAAGRLWLTLHLGLPMECEKKRSIAIPLLSTDSLPSIKSFSFFFLDSTRLGCSLRWS